MVTAPVEDDLRWRFGLIPVLCRIFSPLWPLHIKQRGREHMAHHVRVDPPPNKSFLAVVIITQLTTAIKKVMGVLQ
jgi:hypothetical protein